jgi:Family of unknown function (DUF6311)
MWPRLRHWLSQPWVIALVLGLAVGLYALPFHMLDPTNIGWLNRDDTLAHWLGWEHFRHSPLLQLPLGKSDFYGLEKSSTVVFSDSIPLVALLLHPLERLLPTPFQYLGLWSLLCFVLQAYFGTRLASLVMRPPAAIAATLLFLVSAPMLVRMHVHTSLLSHWLPLAAVYFYFSLDDWRWRRWGALIAVAALVHGYLFAMVTVVWLAHLGKMAALGKLAGGRRVVLAAAGRALLVVLAVGAVMWLAGYFGVRGPTQHLYGQARYDLMNPICSYGLWSVATKPFLCGNRWNDWDGQAFLGLGTFLVLGAAALGAIALRVRQRRWPDLSSRLPRWPLLVACLFLVAFAATNDVVFGTKELVSYPLPRWWLDKAENFRSSGRMIWPVFYVEIFGIVALFARVIPARWQALILLPAGLFQAYDYRQGIERVNRDIPTANRIHQLSPVWDQLAHYERLISVPAPTAPPGWHDLAWQAAKRGLATNVGYFGRIDPVRESAGRRRWVDTITRGPFDPRSVYVFNDQGGLWDAARARKGPDDVMITVDGQRVLFPGGARYGLVDEPQPALPALPLGQWRRVSEKDEAAIYLTQGWYWPESWGRWSEQWLAGLTIQQPAGGSGLERTVALEVVAFGQRPRQRYRVRVEGELIAEGKLVEQASVLQFTVPARLNRHASLSVEIELPDAQWSPDGRILAIGLRQLWISAAPGEQPPLPPPPPSST